MWDKKEAASQMVEEKFPLFTPEIRRALYEVPSHNTNAPIPNFSGVLELVQRYPEHFSIYARSRARECDADRKVVWSQTDPDGEEYTRAQIKRIRRYLHVCLSLRRRWVEKEHNAFLEIYERFFLRKNERDAFEGAIADQGRFFSLPAAALSDAQRDHWLNLPMWTIEEATALCLGLDPTIVTQKSVEIAVQDGKSAFAPRYLKLKDKLNRAIDARQLASPIKPKSFMKWTADNNIVSSLGDSCSLSNTSDGYGDALPSEYSKPAVHSMYRIILGLAAAKYGLGPSEPHKLRETPEFKAMLRDIELYIAGANKITLDRYLTRAFSYAREKEGVWKPVKKS